MRSRVGGRPALSSLTSSFFAVYSNRVVSNSRTFLDPSVAAALICCDRRRESSFAMDFAVAAAVVDFAAAGGGGFVRVFFRPPPPWDAARGALLDEDRFLFLVAVAGFFTGEVPRFCLLETAIPI